MPGRLMRALDANGGRSQGSPSGERTLNAVRGERAGEWLVGRIHQNPLCEERQKYSQFRGSGSRVRYCQILNILKQRGMLACGGELAASYKSALAPATLSQPYHSV